MAEGSLHVWGWKLPEAVEAALRAQPRLTLSAVSEGPANADVILAVADGLSPTELGDLLNVAGMIPIVALGADPDGAGAVALIEAGIDDVAPLSLADSPGALLGCLRRARARRGRSGDVESCKLLNAALEHATDGVTITHPDGAIIYANAAQLRMTGYSRADTLGRKPSLWKSGRHDEAFYAKLWRTLEAGSVWAGSFVNQRKDGRHIEVDCTIAPVRDAEGHTTHYVALQRDASEHRMLERQVRHAQKLEAMGTLTGGIAHEFNNYLAAIVGYAEFALEGAAPDSELHGDMRRVLEAADKAHGLVESMLAFSRSAEDAATRLDVRPLVKETLKLLDGSIPRSIQVVGDIAPECPMIVADPTQVHQVVMNLCSNAVHAMETEGGELRVVLDPVQLDAPTHCANGALPAGAYLRLSVQDTGEGMPAETLEHVFEPFFTTKDPGEGTGLGLSVVHGIVTSAGGDIMARSTPGAGSEFTVYWPVSDA